MITSPDNPKVKAARALLERKGREQTGRCLVEGVRLVEDATRAGIAPALVFFTASIIESDRGATLLAAAERLGAVALEISPALLGTLSDTVTSQGLAAVIPIPQPTFPAQPNLILVLDRIRDPGNLGTIVRSAAGAGVDAILLAPGCVDPWNPKALRAGMGAHFRIPILIAPTWATIASQLAGLMIWCAEPQGGVFHDSGGLDRPLGVDPGWRDRGLERRSRATCCGARDDPDGRGRRVAQRRDGGNGDNV